VPNQPWGDVHLQVQSELERTSTIATLECSGPKVSFIVSPPIKAEPFSYDAEFSIVFNYWWHKSVYDQEMGLNLIPFRVVGEP
jgi:hypothetical protein